jgi:hypothetical protein
MKKYLGLTAVISSYLMSAQSVFAQGVESQGSTDAPQITIQAPSQVALISNLQAGSVIQFVITLLFVIALFIAIVFLIYGGIKWILSGGDEKQVEAARNHIVAAIIGIVIVMGSFLILNVIFTVLTGTGLDLNHLCIPSLAHPTCGGSTQIGG